MKTWRMETTAPWPFDSVYSLANRVLEAWDAQIRMAGLPGYCRPSYDQVESVIATLLRLRGVDPAKLTYAVLDRVRVSVVASHTRLVPYGEARNLSVFGRLVQVFKPLKPATVAALWFPSDSNTVWIVFHVLNLRTRAHILYHKDDESAWRGVALDFPSEPVQGFAIPAFPNAAVEDPVRFQCESAYRRFGRAVVRWFASPLYHLQLLLGLLRSAPSFGPKPVAGQRTEQSASDAGQNLVQGGSHVDKPANPFQQVKCPDGRNAGETPKEP